MAYLNGGLDAMDYPQFSRLPRHIGIIPDGNRRWAEQNGYTKEKGYSYGIEPGLKFYQACVKLGIQEITYYGFTQDNTKRPSLQTQAFQKACVDAVRLLESYNADLLVVGNTQSSMFPEELKSYANKRVKLGKSGIRVNFLVNYSWQWDLLNAFANKSKAGRTQNDISGLIGSSEISRIDLIVRWGGRRRLSGFLPVQTIYSDFYIIEELWPDYTDEQLFQALLWYQLQDITLGG
jgi:undecaprenyl diphosphate synthase